MPPPPSTQPPRPSLSLSKSECIHRSPGTTLFITSAPLRSHFRAKPRRTRPTALRQRPRACASTPSLRAGSAGAAHFERVRKACICCRACGICQRPSLIRPLQAAGCTHTADTRTERTMSATASVFSPHCFPSCCSAPPGVLPRVAGRATSRCCASRAWGTELRSARVGAARVTAGAAAPVCVWSSALSRGATSASTLPSSLVGPRSRVAGQTASLTCAGPPAAGTPCG